MFESLILLTVCVDVSNRLKTIRSILKTLAIVVVAYIIFFSGLHMFQDSLIFQKKQLAHDFTFKFDQPFEEFTITASDGEKINALLFRSGQPSKGLILYFHGNADNLARWGQYAIDFTSLGYDIVMADYRGYGKSTGTPGEEVLYRDAETLKEWVDKNVPHSRLIIYGRSLGSAVASHLAIDAKPDLLILETPFDELKGALALPLRSVLNIFPLHYEFPNKKFIPKIECRKVIIHGTADWVVPLSSALELKPLLGTHDRFVIIEGGAHKNLREFSEYHQVLKEELEKKDD